MSRRRTLAVVIRVLRQLRHDHRTVALVLLVPPLLLWLVKGIFTEFAFLFDRTSAMMFGLFPFTLIFVVTSIVTLRERTQGTLERLMASPIGRGDLMAGYGIAFLLVAAVQTAITVIVGIGLLGIPHHGPLWIAVAFVLLLALIGIGLGLFLSAFARTEFQAIQFLPAFVLPQILLAGLLVPIDQLPPVLEYIARVLPLTYAFEGLNGNMRDGMGFRDGHMWIYFVVCIVSPIVLLIAGSLTLRRHLD
jgi:ABC-2 type transport system permease protein